MNQYKDNELDYCHEVTVPEMIAARDERVEKQQYLCKKYGKTVICFMLNIPGPHKIAPDFAAAFDLGVSRIREALADRAIDGTSDDVDQALYHSSKNDASKDNTDHRADAVPIEHTNELPVLEEHIERNVTGFILYMAVDADPIEVKKRMCVIEERMPSAVSLTSMSCARMVRRCLVKNLAWGRGNASCAGRKRISVPVQEHTRFLIWSKNP